MKRIYICDDIVVPPFESPLIHDYENYINVRIIDSNFDMRISSRADKVFYPGEFITIWNFLFLTQPLNRAINN